MNGRLFELIHSLPHNPYYFILVGVRACKFSLGIFKLHVGGVKKTLGFLVRPDALLAKGSAVCVAGFFSVDTDAGGGGVERRGAGLPADDSASHPAAPTPGDRPFADLGALRGRPHLGVHIIEAGHEQNVGPRDGQVWRVPLRPTRRRGARQ